jgi:hypothetical protein
LPFLSRSSLKAGGKTGGHRAEAARRPRFLNPEGVVRSVRRMYIKESGTLPSILLF